MTRRTLLPLVLFLGVAVGGFFYFYTNPPRGSQQGSDLRAQTHHGQIQSLSDLDGDLRLVYFGYMNCPDVCLNAAVSIASTLKTLALDAPEARARVTNVFVTLDPADDTIDGPYNELAAYMDSRYAGNGVAMRPKDQAAAQHMAAAFGIRFEYVPDEFFPAGYRVDHASLIFLTDAQGRVLTYYPDRTPGRVIAAEVQTYLAQLDAA